MSSADEKCLALYYAYAALVRALCKSGALQHDELMVQLAGARGQLDRLGETEAATFLAAVAQNLLAVDE